MEVQRLKELPTKDEFKRLEEKNMPVLLYQAVKDWPAFTKWNPATGGLMYLKTSAGEAVVQAMSSSEGSTFYGDIRSHERVVLSFADFIDRISMSEEQTSHMYLAQVPIHARDSPENPALLALAPDIPVPEFLHAENISNINMWMSCAVSRSSIHYDPYHNVLGVVAGRKEVTLWPPSAAPYLYPMPLHGEASNHSQVDFVQPDYERYPRFKDASKHSQMVTLDTGDALFIPEGWFHQVDSAAVTIAVNFWWPSKVSSAFGSHTHMDAYYLRRVLANLLDAEKELMLVKNQVVVENSSETGNSTWTWNPEAMRMEDLTPMEANKLGSLVSWVSSVLEKNVEPDQSEDDPVARAFANSNALSLRRILTVMVYKFPRTLEALVLHGLSPAAAELMTRKFEEMDVTATEHSQEEFYKLFYSVFEDSQVAMGALLDRKESFASKALSSVMERFLNLKL